MGVGDGVVITVLVGVGVGVGVWVGGGVRVGVGVGEGVDVKVAVGVWVGVGAGGMAVGDVVLCRSPQAVNKNKPRVSKDQMTQDLNCLGREDARGVKIPQVIYVRI